MFRNSKINVYKEVTQKTAEKIDMKKMEVQIEGPFYDGRESNPGPPKHEARPVICQTIVKKVTALS